MAVALTQAPPVGAGGLEHPTESAGLIVMETLLPTILAGLKSSEANGIMQGELQQLVVMQLVVNV